MTKKKWEKFKNNDLGLQPVAYRCHYPVSCHLTIYENVKVIRIADKSKTTTFEFLVELVKVDIGEYRCIH